MDMVEHVEGKKIDMCLKELGDTRVVARIFKQSYMKI
jgi:hypothetical protein